jgi:iron complex outermembrane recepter protein
LSRSNLVSAPLRVTAAAPARRACVYALACLAPLLSTSILGQEADTVEEIIVTGQPIGDLGLDARSSVGTRLGLSVLETPATVEIVDSAVMRARGYRSVAEAVQSLPGVVSGENPAAPSTFAMRGFSRGEIMVLRDGIWLGPTDMAMRPQNTFNLERIEVLRGPASVLHGQGMVGGTVDTIIRRPSADQPRTVELLGAYGRYGTYQVGLGVAGELGAELWYRVDLNRYGSDGYVDRMDPQSSNVTASLLWGATERLDVEFQVDYLDDRLANYWGTPLVPASVAAQPLTGVVRTASDDTVDRRTRFRNYNVADGRSDSDQLLLRSDLTWRIADNIELRNTTWRFDADRGWKNAEGYVFCTAVVDVCTETGVIQRYYGYFFVYHDQRLLGNRLMAHFDQRVGERSNRLVVGLELTDLDLVRSRGFRINVPQVPGDAVDLLDPVPGLYGPEELRGRSPTAIDTRALFVENAFEISPRLTLVGALRAEQFGLRRENYNAAGGLEAGSSFTRDFDWVSWRVGVVYRLAEGLVAYGQYSDSRTPVDSNLFLVNAGENFDLPEAEQWEIGLKKVRTDGRAELTAAYYRIKRKDILERIGIDSATSVGGRDSDGVELAATLVPSDRWRIGANAAYVSAEFRPSENFVSFAGNTPPNIPEWTAALSAGYTMPRLPLELGGSLRYVDKRFGDNANTVVLGEHTTLDLYAAWQRSNYRVTARVNNATDKIHASWSDVFYLQQTDPDFLYANQIMLAAPRTYEISVAIAF